MKRLLLFLAAISMVVACTPAQTVDYLHVSPTGEVEWDAPTEEILPGDVVSYQVYYYDTAQVIDDHITNIFTAEDGTTTVVPASITWTLMNRDGVVVNGRDAVSVVTPASSVTITMTGTDLSMISLSNNERIFKIEWVYTSSYGSGLEMSEQAVFIIDPEKGA